MSKGLFAKSNFSLRMREHLGDPSRKAAYTKGLFDEIAHVYDRFALGPMSFFQEIRWKRFLVRHLPNVSSGPAVDLATGTGQLAFMLSDRFADMEIVGVDISEAMLAIARSKNASPRITFKCMDLGKLEFGDRSVALFTGGYALRNTPDLARLLNDIRRMLKPDGVAAFLDFSKPSNPVHRAIILAGLRVWLSFWSLVQHRNLRIYNYIPSSLRYFPDHRALGRIIESSGFAILHRRRFMFGIAEVLIVRRA